MIYIEPQHLPFALVLLPFFISGIVLSPSVQDWSRGNLSRGNAIAVIVGLIITVAWCFAILHSVRAKRRQGKEKLLGRELSSWLWAPPATFVIGFAICFAMCNLNWVKT